MIDRVEIDVAPHLRCAQQRLDLRPEIQPSTCFRVVQRLDADAIARQQQGAGPRVPDRQPEHPAQPGDRVRTPLLVGMNDRFGVG